MTESGLSDIITELERFHFEIKETSYTDTVSGQNGFIAVRDGVTITYDGAMYINNEEVETPWGTFELILGEHVQWFLENIDQIVTSIAHEQMKKHGGTDDSHIINPEDIDTFSGEDKG